MDSKKIGQFISELRKEHLLSQKELAQKLSITDKAVSKWETGRGIPDISILQPLAEILDVSVVEILNGERIVEEKLDVNQDEKFIRKLKIKKYIRYLVEIIITAIFFYALYIYFDTYMGYGNVLDVCLHTDEISFISICTLALAVIIVIWIITVIVSAVFKKKASVLKTIIICSVIFFIASTSIHVANMEDNRYLEQYDYPIETINYIHYEDFFNDEYETQINIEDTNDKITEHYTCMFDGKYDNENGTLNFAYTTCITANEFNIVDSLYKQNKRINNYKNPIDLDDATLSKLNAVEGCYMTDIYCNGDIEIIVVKNNSYFDINVSKSNINDENLISLISNL